MRFILIALFSLLAACSTLNKPEQSPSTVRYNILVNELKNTIQVDAIVEARKLYLTTPYASRLGLETQLINRIETAIEEGHWQICIADNNELLAVHYTSLFAHYSAMVCQYELHQPELSHYHQQMLNGILEAFWQTGNGEQTDSAFFAINDNDIKSFIEFHGLELQSMTTTPQAQRSLVQTQVYDMEKDESFTWFFRLAKPN